MRYAALDDGALTAGGLSRDEVGGSLADLAELVSKNPTPLDRGRVCS